MSSRRYDHLSDQGNNMEKKICIAVISVLLFAAVVLTTYAIFERSRHHHQDVSSPGDHGVSSSMKAIATICAPTDYRDTCVNSLSSAIPGNSTVSPKDLVKAAVKVTIDEITSAFHLSSGIASGTNDTMQLAALTDCQELLQYATDELQASFSQVGDSDMNTLQDHSSELKNWLSAVVSYQQTCLDGVTHPELKAAMQNGLLNATQLTSNALAIVSEISTILDVFKMPSVKSYNSRRLLEENFDVYSMDTEGYPAWFSSGDRRLLAAHISGSVRPNVIVSKDGSGNFNRISDALSAMPEKHAGRYVIYVKEGVYEENVMVTKKMTNVFMYGDGPKKTIVSGNKNFVDGTPTFQTATFAAIGERFMAKSMGFRNNAGPSKHQAVALRVQSDMSAFFNCRMDGFQDTLYAQTHRQFYRNCVVSGTIDFIFGDSAVVLQNCLIIVRKPMDNQKNTVTAHGRTDRREPTGIVIHNCRIVPDVQLFPLRFKLPSYLGRPWKEFSRTVIMESTIGDFIQPEGWLPWDGDFALKTLFYAEYANKGPGAGTKRRVRWPGYKVITNRREALQYTVGSFIQGNLWLKATDAPYFLGLKPSI